MSDAVSTSPASAPSPEPIWEASIPPTARWSMPISWPPIGPPSAWSCGMAAAIELTEDAAIGSTRPFHTSVVPTIHSARLHAAVEVTPDGKSVASSSQWSASRTASATWSCWRWLGEGSAVVAACLRARSSARSQLSGPSYGCIIAWIWVNIAPKSGAPPAPGVPPIRPPKNCSNGVPLNGLFCPSSGSLLMPQRYADGQPRAGRDGVDAGDHPSAARLGSARAREPREAGRAARDAARRGRGRRRPRRRRLRRA